MTEQESKDFQRRKDEDFKFFILCHSKGNPGMYELLRDRSLDDAANPKQGELFDLKKEQS
jgi:hypothetical protein